MTTAVYSYERISTKEDRELQSFQRQDNALERYEKDNGIKIDLSFRDDASGKSFDRPQWQVLEKIVKKGDTIIFKELSRFTREAVNGYEKYMSLYNLGVNMVFIDNPTMNTEYIHMLNKAANEQDLVTKTALEGTIKLLLIVELDRVEKQRLTIVKNIRDGISASDKKSGRPTGKLDKMTDVLKADIKAYLKDRSISQTALMKKHQISRNTLKKYIEIVKESENQ